ncbi:MAG: hypothetical protein GTN73_03000 [Candidatus Aminicenantes bacterium]|nr:hypothetical protein [Candidatus Aminicenantes bacterium]
MNIKKRICIVFFFLLFSCFIIPDSVYSYVLFIYRPYLEKRPVSREKKVTLHGEFFGHLQLPSTFPSYNDLSGKEDRWNYGFRNIIFITENTVFLAQLVTHDDNHSRTKFDWHFSLRQFLSRNLVLIIGHDSNHDLDHRSAINQSRYYVNRNYIGLGLPSKKGDFYIEPFLWYLLENTKQRGHLDLSGDSPRYEYGLRVGRWFEDRVGLHFQIFYQTEKLFSRGQTHIADLIVRIRLLDWLELSAGGGIWKDIKTSPSGSKQKFYKLTWGVAIPF